MAKTEIAPLNSLQRTRLRNFAKEFKENTIRQIEIVVQVDAERLWIEHGSLSKLLQAEFAIDKSQAYRLIKAAQVKANISVAIQAKALTPAEDKGVDGAGFSPMGEKSAGGTLPVNERQLRPLAKLKDPEEQAAAWQDAVDTAGGEPTGAQVEEVVETYLADNEPYKEEEETAEPTRRERMEEAARRLSALSREIQALAKKAAGLGDPHLDDIKLDILKSQLRAAGGTLLSCRGVRICECVRGCKVCHRAGWLTREMADGIAE